jgi:hypothetical protein
VKPTKAALAGLRENFLERARRDAAALAPYRSALAPDGHSVRAVEQVETIAHGLEGAGGIFGFPRISELAAVLARSAEGMLEGSGSPTAVQQALDDLLAEIERE